MVTKKTIKGMVKDVEKMIAVDKLEIDIAEKLLAAGKMIKCKNKKKIEMDKKLVEMLESRKEHVKIGEMILKLHSESEKIKGL